MMVRCRAAFLIFVGLSAVLGGGCSFLVDSTAEQCTSNSDCDVFGASCNLTLKVCEKRPPAAALCQAAIKPVARLQGERTSNEQLTCDKDYLLIGPVLVKPGVTLTIQAGTTLRGDTASKGTLVVEQGARLVADGKADLPVVFTSAAAVEARRPGDWGGLIVLGRATTNAVDPQVPGLASGSFGGSNDDDDSGTLRFVRIEYGGLKLAAGSESNGLTLAAVGRGTTIDHVQVRQSGGDCFGLLGGTVNAKHLVCQGSGDDGFDFDLGYRGSLQFVVLQHDPAVLAEADGIEADNDPTGSERLPYTEPTIFNATLCGQNKDVEREQYGILVRRGASARIVNSIVTGFDAALDIRDTNTTLELVSNLFWGNLVKPIGYDENGSNETTEKDDDGGLIEAQWALAPERRNATVDPGLSNCFNQDQLDLAPAAPLTEGASAPPGDGFLDPKASYIGAFRDANDRWAAGSWIVWGPR